MPKRISNATDRRPVKRLKRDGIDLKSAFRFESEQAKIARLSFDAKSLLSQRVRNSYESTEFETPLAAELSAQAQLNRSHHFVTLERHLRPLVQTVPQVYHHAESITQLLTNSLAKDPIEHHAAEAILPLIPSFIETLPDDSILEAIAPPLTQASLSVAFASHNAATLGAAIRVLAFCFHRLSSVWSAEPERPWRLIRYAFGVDDNGHPDSIHEAQALLLGQPDQHQTEPDGGITAAPAKSSLQLRRLLASAYSFLVRKAKDQKQVDHILEPLFADTRCNCSATFHESVAFILIESMRSTKTRLQRRADLVLASALSDKGASKQTLECLVSLGSTEGSTAELAAMTGALLERSPTPVRLLRLLEVPESQRKKALQKALDATVRLTAESARDVLLFDCRLLKAASLEEAEQYARGMIISMALLPKKTIYAVILCEALLQLDWPHIETVALPSLLSALNGRTDKTIEAFIARHNWTESRITLRESSAPEQSLIVSLEDFHAVKSNDDSCLRLAHKIHLVPYLSKGCASSIEPRLHKILIDLLAIDTEDTFEDIKPKHGRALLFAVLLSSFRGRFEISEDQMEKLIVKYQGYPRFMAALVSCQNSVHMTSPIGRRHLVESLSSRHSSVRKVAAILWNSDSSVARACCNLENLPLTFEAVRERCLTIKRLPASGVTGEDHISFVVHYLLGVLQDKIEPISQAAQATLAHLLRTHTNMLWHPIFRQLEDAILKISVHSLNTADLPAPAAITTQDDALSVQNALHAAITTWLEEQRLQEHQDSDVTSLADIVRFEGNLLRTLQHAPKFPDVWTARLCQNFCTAANNSVGVDNDILEEHSVSSARYTPWLVLLSQTNGKWASTVWADRMQTLLDDFLLHNDRKIRHLAVCCLLDWRQPEWSAVTNLTKDLLDPRTFRDAIGALFLDKLDPITSKDLRQEYLPILFRLLFAEATTTGRERQISSRREVILANMTRCSSPELTIFVALMLKPYRHLTRDTWFAGWSATQAPPRRRIGFLSLCTEVLRHLGRQLDPTCLDHLCAVCLGLLAAAQGRADATSRSLRVKALRCFSDFFRFAKMGDFEPDNFVADAFRAIISPRLETFAREAAQAPDPLLDLAVLWAGDPATVTHLYRHDNRFLPAIFEVIAIRNVKATVVNRVLDLLDLLLQQIKEADEEILRSLEASFGPLMEHLTSYLTAHANTTASDGALLSRVVAMACNFASYITTPFIASQYCSLACLLLNKSYYLVSDSIKVDLLRSLDQLQTIHGASLSQHPLSREIELTLSKLFSIIKSRQAEQQLSLSFSVVSRKSHSDFREIADLLIELTAYSLRRLDEPDYDRRAEAFIKLNDDVCNRLDENSWLPVLHLMHRLALSTDESTFRMNACRTMRTFIGQAAVKPALHPLVHTVLLPHLSETFHVDNEAVLSDALGVLGYAVSTLTDFPLLQEMSNLLVGGDKEADAFHNLLHIQQHRRIRALSRIADLGRSGHMSVSSIKRYFLPIIEHLIRGKANSNLAHAAIRTFGIMTACLPWSDYSGLLYQHLRLASIADSEQRRHVQVVTSILRNFNFSLNSSEHQGSHQRHQAVQNRLLPRLQRFLADRTKYEEALRLPMAEGIAALIRHLPDVQNERAVSMLTGELGVLLRSPSQDVRDQCRATLRNITALLGVSRLGSIVRDLQATLRSGRQLHVLAFTVHDLLIHLLPLLDSKDIDVALDYVLPVLHADLWGEPAKARIADDFRKSAGHFHEMKVCKSVEAFYLLSRAVAPDSLPKLLHSVRTALDESDSLATFQLATEVLKKISHGLDANSHFEAATLLLLCNDLITLEFQTASVFRITTIIAQQLDHRKDAPFVALGLDLLTRSVRQGRFDLSAAAILSRLDVLVGQVGRVLESKHTDVVTKAFRALIALARCPLPSLHALAPTLIAQIAGMILNESHSASERTETSLRAITALLRCCKAVPFSDVEPLLTIVRADLQDNNRRLCALELTRVLVSRSFASTEFCFVMDRIAELLVTSEDEGVRENSRSLYLQYLLDYPHSRHQFEASVSFLIQNLSYTYENGRISVVNILGALVTRVGLNLLESIAESLFVAFIMAIANSESSILRQTTMDAVKQLFGRVSDSTRGTLVSLASTWAKNSAHKHLNIVSLQIASALVTEADREGRHTTPALLHSIADMLLVAASSHEQGHEMNLPRDELEWRTLYVALEGIQRIVKTYTHHTQGSIMHLASALLLHPHTWIRLSASRLLGILLSAADADDFSLPFLANVAFDTCSQLGSPSLSEVLALQSIKNLAFVGRTLASRCVDAEHTTLTSYPLREASLQFDGLLNRLDRLAQSGQIGTSANRHLVNAKIESASVLTTLSAFRALAALAVAINKEQLELHLGAFIKPCIRVASQPQQDQNDAAALANDTLDLIRSKSDANAFARAWTQAEKNVANKRRARQEEAALQLLNNPGFRLAKRKARREVRKSKAGIKRA